MVTHVSYVGRGEFAMDNSYFWILNYFPKENIVIWVNEVFCKHHKHKEYTLES